MELLDTLASIGLTTKVLQIIIIGSIGIVLAGLFWRFIVIGAGIVFIVFVLTMPSKAGSIVTGIEKEAEKVEASGTQEVAPPEFIDDCQNINKTSKAECIKLWNEKDE